MIATRGIVSVIASKLNESQLLILVVNHNMATDRMLVEKLGMAERGLDIRLLLLDRPSTEKNRNDLSRLGESRNMVTLNLPNRKVIGSVVCDPTRDSRCKVLVQLIKKGNEVVAILGSRDASLIGTSLQVLAEGKCPSGVEGESTVIKGRRRSTDGILDIGLSKVEVVKLGDN